VDSLSIDLDVPYFKQAMIGSCGPACLLMVMKYHRPNLKLDRVSEFRVWIFAQLFPFGMTDVFGLAGFAAGRQFKASVIKEERKFELFFNHGRFAWIFTNILVPFFRFNYERIKSKAIKKGVKHHYKKIDFETIEYYVKKKIPPIVMVEQTEYISDKNYPDGILHWVVVTGFNSEKVKINDPDIGPLVIPKTDFIKSINLTKKFNTDKRLVIIEK
jgi:hypothetical protein